MNKKMLIIATIILGSTHTSIFLTDIRKANITKITMSPNDTHTFTWQTWLETENNNITRYEPNLNKYTTDKGSIEFDTTSTLAPKHSRKHTFTITTKNALPGMLQIDGYLGNGTYAGPVAYVTITNGKTAKE